MVPSAHFSTSVSAAGRFRTHRFDAGLTGEATSAQRSRACRTERSNRASGQVSGCAGSPLSQGEHRRGYCQISWNDSASHEDADLSRTPFTIYKTATVEPSSVKETTTASLKRVRTAGRRSERHEPQNWAGRTGHRSSMGVPARIAAHLLIREGHCSGPAKHWTTIRPIINNID